MGAPHSRVAQGLKETSSGGVLPATPEAYFDLAVAFDEGFLDLARILNAMLTEMTHQLLPRDHLGAQFAGNISEPVQRIVPEHDDQRRG